MTRLQEIEVMLHPYIRQGFMNFKDLGWKEVKINNAKVNERTGLATFELEGKYSEKYNIDVKIEEVPQWLHYGFKTILPVVFIEKEKEVVNTDKTGVIVGYTKNYKKFHSTVTKIHPSPGVIACMEEIGNITPITVCENEFGEYVIIDGVKRFNYLKSKGKEIFYVNVTSTLNFSQLLSSTKLTNSIQIACKNNPKWIWENLSKKWKKYKLIDEFLEKEKIGLYINKTHFLLLCCKLDWEKMTTIKLEMNDIINMFQKVVDIICLNELDTNIKENKKQIYLEIKKEILIDKLVEEIKIGDNIVKSLFNERGELDYIEYSNGFYEIGIGKEKVEDIEVEEFIEKETVNTNKISITIGTPNILTYLNIKRNLIKEILKYDIAIEKIDELLQV